MWMRMIGNASALIGWILVVVLAVRYAPIEGLWVVAVFVALPLFVVLRKQWRNRRTPETVGLGTLCDEHGFASQGESRSRQALYHFQSFNGIGLGDVRKVRDWGRDTEALIQAELRRLSALWP